MTARSYLVVIGAFLLCLGSVGASGWARAADASAGALFALPAESDRAAHAAIVLPAAVSPSEESPDLEARLDTQLNLLKELPPELWEPDALAESLGPDPVAAFEFVRDHVAFDPYPGVLRGGTGALAARAGNAWDRALLLQSLLEHNGHVARLAFAELDDQAVDRLLAVAAQGAAAPLDGADLTAAASTFDLEALAARARRDYALLTEALDAAGKLDALGQTDSQQDGRLGAVVPDLRAAVRSHAWVQVEQADGSWLDLDTTMPDAEPGVALAAASATADEAPEEMLQTVMVRVLVETLAGGELEESAALEVLFTAVEAASAEIWLQFQPEQASGSPALLGSVGGKEWQPVLLAGDEGFLGTTFPLRSSGGGGFGGMFGGGGGGAQVTRVTLQLVARSPDGTERAAKRILLDRVDPQRREAGDVSASSLAEIPSTGVPYELEAVHNILFSNGGLNLREQVMRRAVAIYDVSDYLLADESGATPNDQDLLSAFVTTNRELVLASERAFVGGLSRSGMRAFVGGARSFVVSVAPSAEVEDGVVSIVDLALDGVAFVGAGDGASEARERVWYGVLQSALETQNVERRWRAFDPAEVELDSVSLRMDEELTVLEPAAAAALSGAAPELAAVLQSGQIVVAVGTPGQDGAFWALEGSTGATRSILEPGLRASRGRVGEWYKGPSYKDNKAIRVGDLTNKEQWELREQLKRYGEREAATNKCSGNDYVALVVCVAKKAINKVTVLSTIVGFVAWWILEQF